MPRKRVLHGKFHWKQESGDFNVLQKNTEFFENGQQKSKALGIFYPREHAETRNDNCTPERKTKFTNFTFTGDFERRT